MSATEIGSAGGLAPRRRQSRASLDRWLPMLAVGPVLAIPVLYVVGFTAWTVWISFTGSTLLPSYELTGWNNYVRLLNNRTWQVAFTNLVLYGSAFMLTTTVVGFLLAILLDQHVRGENALRAIFLYPMAVSLVATGTVWGWMLNPSIGVQSMVRSFGWAGFRFDWIVDRDMAIYAVVIAAVWQASGFAMTLFLAGLRSLDADLYRAAQIDGAGPLRLYSRVVLPAIWPVTVAILVILLQFAIKTYDLVLALTGGGPGLATTVPTIVVYNFMFQRGQLGMGSAAAVLLLLSLVVVALPVIALRWWRGRKSAAHG